MYPNLIICLVFVLLLWGLSTDFMTTDGDDELAHAFDLYPDDDETSEMRELPGAL